MDCLSDPDQRGQRPGHFKFIPGVGTVGAGAFAFTKRRESVTRCPPKSTRRTFEESGLFDSRRSSMIPLRTSARSELMHASSRPKVIALNQSMDDPRCDGLTVGRRRWLTVAMPEGMPNIQTVSADRFLPALFDALRRL